jgi:SAM-dependent methyltransferase
MKEPVDIIIPTYENYDMLKACISSMQCTYYNYPHRIIVVNNGDNELKLFGISEDRALVVDAGENLGWTGGLELGLKQSTSKYVMFANDDIFIPFSSSSWLLTMVTYLDSYGFLGAIGPSSNVVSGAQNIFRETNYTKCFVPYLIGFCMLVRRKALDEAGGVQHMQHGGDDFDLSIRLRKAGYGLMSLRDAFVYHHGFVTGHKVHGTRDKPNGWNSNEMIESTNMELIRKHGFVEWRNTITGLAPDVGNVMNEFQDAIKEENKIAASYVNGGNKIVELGCGNKLTVPNAIGVDRVPKGEMNLMLQEISTADITADVTEPLPFDDNSVDCIIARHILEHCLDTVQTLKQWSKVLKKGGRMIIACPDQNVCDGIHTNNEHMHAITPESLDNITDLIGLKKIDGVSQPRTGQFTNCYEKTF